MTGVASRWRIETQGDWLAGVLGVAVLYVATAKLGFLMAIHPGNVTAVWPPSGIALAALLIGVVLYLHGKQERKNAFLWPRYQVNAAV